MIVFPNAKINLGLRVLSKRPDGFHDLESVFHPVRLSDVLEIVQAGKNPPGPSDSLTLSGIPLEAGEDNLCIQALRLMRDKHGIPAVHMHLHKRIPTGAGLGGGSSDAAFTLKALNGMFSLDLDDDILMEYAAKIGSDCPFFIRNEPSLATGRGEILEPHPVDLSGYYLGLVLPGIMVDTAWAYKRIKPSRQGQAIREIVNHSPGFWKGRLINHFEQPVFEEYPEIKNLKKALYDAGAVYASMTGSGSAVFGLFSEEPGVPPEIGRHPWHTERLG